MSTSMLHLGRDIWFLLFSLLSAGLFALAQDAGAQTFWPAVIPLAVRTPYLSCWQNTTVGPSTVNWPVFWGGGTLGWAGHIRVDDKVYEWLGSADTNSEVQNITTATLLNTTITSTRTIQSIRAGTMDLTITFLSPIEPADWVKQSLPFIYLSVNATSNDGNTHDVQLYADVSAEWLSGNDSAIANWTTVASDSYMYHKIMLEDPIAFTEYEESGQVQDGILYHASTLTSSVTYQTNRDIYSRNNFTEHGELFPDDENINFRAISSNYPVFAISTNLGTISSMSDPVVWVLGYVRNPTIQYTASSTTENLSPYWVTQYSTIEDAIPDIISDFSNALSRAESLDESVQKAAANISSGTQYSDLVSLAARQVFGGLEITVAEGSDGSWNASDVKMFMKDIGVSRRVSPVEGLFAAFPAFMYFNSSFGRPLLEPLLQVQSSLSSSYAASDLGTEFPIAADPTMTADEGVEQSGNMLIMAMAHAKLSGDTTLIEQYYELLGSWADYLVNNALTPVNQYSVDTASVSTNLTNLALKGIIGINAMSGICKLLGETSDYSTYSAKASDYIAEWQDLTFSGDPLHSISNYGDSSLSWSLLYNLYADVLLESSIVNSSYYESQTEFYQNLLSVDADTYTYGIPINSNVEFEGNSALIGLAAATVTNATLREQMLSLVWARASDNKTWGIFPTQYNVETGIMANGSASPVQGGLFAPLTLNFLNDASDGISGGSTTDTTKSNNIGAIVGGVVGGVCGLALIVLAAFFFQRYRRRRSWAQRERELIDGGETNPEVANLPPPVPFPYESMPFMDHRSNSQSSASQSDGTPDQRLHMSPTTVSGNVTSPSRGYSKSQEALRSAMGLPVEMVQFGRTGSHLQEGEGDALGASPPAPVTGSERGRTNSELVDLREELNELRQAMMQGMYTDRLEAPPSYE